MSACAEPSVSEVPATELDAATKKKVKGLRYYYKNRERILAAQMIQRRDDPAFQERQRAKEEAAREKAAALALKEAHAAEKERLRVERQAAKDLQLAKKEAASAAKQEKQLQKIEDQKRRRDAKIKEKALALGLCLPPV